MNDTNELIGLIVGKLGKATPALDNSADAIPLKKDGIRCFHTMKPVHLFIPSANTKLKI